MGTSSPLRPSVVSSAGGFSFVGIDMLFVVYDLVKVERMGEDEGYMGTFFSEAEAMEYIQQFAYLFEGTAIIKLHPDTPRHS